LQVVHGLSIPLGKLGYYLPRTLSRSVASPPSEEPENISPFTLGSRVSSFAIRRRSGVEAGNEVNAASGRAVFKIGGSIIPKRQEDPNSELPDRREGLDASKSSSTSAVEAVQGSSGQGSTVFVGRTIRFPDEPPVAAGQSAGGPGPSRPCQSHVAAL
jgi:hypothetical protein